MRPRSGAASSSPDQIYLDINSVSPEKKREIARDHRRIQGEICGSGGDGAGLAAASQGSHAAGRSMRRSGANGSQAIGMNAKAVSERVGVASAIKMCRSVLIKGLEALAVECLFAARRYGAEEEVLASLEASYPAMGWSRRASGLSCEPGGAAWPAARGGNARSGGSTERCRIRSADGAGHG